jgi:glycosyltransferase involved in cell wall biosynthesis
MKVFCYPVSRNSTYVPLLFTGIEDRYHRVYREDGSLQDAIDEIDRGGNVIVHIHWEEFVLRDCRSDGEADEEARHFVRLLSAIRERNGAIVWTVHNEVPHLIRFERQFLIMRVALAAYADAILVHNRASIEVLAAQVDVDRSRIHLLPHPSYLDQHEDEVTLRAGLTEHHDPRIQGFGWIRLQKGFGEMIGMLPAAFLRTHGAHIRISGDDGEAAAVMAQQADRDDVRWDIRHVPNAEVPSLLRSAACVVLPYERVLTSGVALLAMSVGAMIVAVDIPQLRELLPTESRRFLYPRGDGTMFREIVANVFALAPQERQRIVAANLEVARELHPARIAGRLAAIYDRVGAERRSRAKPQLRY